MTTPRWPPICLLSIVSSFRARAANDDELSSVLCHELTHVAHHQTYPAIFDRLTELRVKMLVARAAHESGTLAAPHLDHDELSESARSLSCVLEGYAVLVQLCALPSRFPEPKRHLSGLLSFVTQEHPRTVDEINDHDVYREAAQRMSVLCDQPELLTAVLSDPRLAEVLFRQWGEVYVTQEPGDDRVALTRALVTLRAQNPNDIDIYLRTTRIAGQNTSALPSAP
jgi:hypothetical protein